MFKTNTDRCGRTIALLISGNVIEDFLDSIGLTLEDYCGRMTGGWGFGYIDALRSAGWKTVLFLISRSVAAPTYSQHTPSGTPVCILPARKAYQVTVHGMVNPYGGSVSGTFGPVTGPRRLACFARKEMAPYLATPLRALARHLRCESCKAILVQEYEYARFDMCVLLGKMLRLPVYATFQGGAGHTGRLEHVIRPLALRAARGLIIGADGEAQRVIEHYRVSPEKIWRIPNPIDLDLWQPIDRGAARQALGLPSHNRIVIYHGRIEMRYKGLDVLLDAWEQVRGHPFAQDTRLLMIGSGRDDAILRERLERPGMSGIQWVDRYELDRAAMRRYLSAADLYVLPSRMEGFPVAPLEAMACGLPIIGTDIPAMLDILEGGTASGGLIVPRENPHALAQAMLRLLEDPNLCRDLGRRARDNVEGRYSVPAVGRQLNDMLTRKDGI